MAKKTLYMESTEISVERTAAEITSELVSAGARQISMEYADGGRVLGMNFVLIVGGLPYPFKLPVRTESIYAIFQQRRSRLTTASEQQDRAQADRVAWRQLLRWVQAQMAIVETGMVQTREVFMPYLLEPSGRKTMFEYLEETRFKALPPGKEA